MFFHVSNQVWNVGTGIEPGNWGRQLSVFGASPIPIDFSFSPLNFAKIMVWEASLETARIAIDPELPSRLNCIFVTDDEQAAVKFRDGFRQGATIYTCEPLGEIAKQHAADFSALEVMNSPIVSSIPQRAIEYWTSPPNGIKEIVYAGSIVITGAL